MSKTKTYLPTAPLVCDEAEAEAAGFACFNPGAHMCVDVPDEMFTISARTSDGRLLTVCFVPYKEGEAAGCVDIKRHDGETVPWNGGESAVFDTVLFSHGGFAHDTRSEGNKPVPLMTVLLGKDKTA